MIYTIVKGGLFMSQKALSILAKIIFILFAILGIAFYGIAVPFGGRDLLSGAPELQYCYLPWLIFMELMVIPDYLVLGIAWRIADSIGKDRAFSRDNGRRFKWISLIALFTTVYFFAGNTVFFLLNMNHPAVYIVSFVLVFIGASISAASAILSYLSQKAADLQEQSDLTI